MNKSALEMPWFDPDEHFSLGGTGHATTLHVDEEEDIIARLHAVVAEVTGKPSEPRKPARIGFLP